MKYYSNDGIHQNGPVDDEQFQELVNQGVITSETLIWEPGMENWQPYGQEQDHRAEERVQDDANDDQDLILRAKESHEVRDVSFEAHEDSLLTCGQCGQDFPGEDMILYNGHWICPQCKPLLVQKIKEGVPVVGEMRYGGFWIRLVAKMVDSFVLFGLFLCIFIPLGIFTQGNPSEVLSFIINLSLPAAYTTLFLGKFGATPGKMACHLKVVTDSGDPIGYGRAFGRHFAEWLSGIILCIGYIMAGFDDEKRTLHDRICNTRVIKRV